MPDTRSVGRILGEGVLIVVSILLAFALDAWWDSRLREVEAAQLVEALATEFDEARGELDRVESRNQHVILAADTLLRKLRAAPGSVSVDARTLAALLLTPTTDPQRGTLDALLSSGDLSLIPDRQLRSRLADWPASLADAQEEERASRTFVLQEFIPFLGTVTDLRRVFDRRLAVHRGAVESALSGVQMEIVLPVSPRLVNLVETRRYLSAFVLSNHAQVRASFDEIMTGLASQRE